MAIKKGWLIGVGLVVVVLFLAACAPKATPTATATPVPTLPPLPAASVPFYESWAASGHAKADSEAFNHWNDAAANPDGVPVACAKCHTNTGIVDFLTGQAKNIAVPGGTITCTTCHNDATKSLSSVTFPGNDAHPGAELTGLGAEATCIVCHQGRESKITVDAAIEGKDADTVVPDLGFINIHYFAAAGTQYGAEVASGYQYDGKLYDMKFTHTEGLTTCQSCHDQHSLQIKVETCSVCHEDVKTADDLKNVRMQGSTKDYNGNGDVTEGMFYEIRGLQDMVMQAIQAYAKDVLKAPIAYDEATYPYFFADANANGKGDEGEKKFASWTPRLLKAAYNYQMSIKDPGGFAHNGKYIVELLYDTTEDLNTKIPTQVDLSKAQRDDAAHFAGDTMPFRDWDDTGLVPGGCAKCHSATGLPTFVATGGSIVVTNKGATNIVGMGAAPVSNGFMCSTCHDETNWPNRISIPEVTMPSGLKVSFGGYDADKKPIADDNNICISCHQGRESTTSMNTVLAGKDPDTVIKGQSFKNVHYLAAGATLFGTEARGMYEFKDKTYLGKNNHPGDGSLATCTSCHETHALEVKIDTCAVCHNGVKDPTEIRYVNDQTDWNGNGNVTESMQAEITGMTDTLYTAMQTYAKDVAGTALVYNTASYPYFFIDTNGNGKAEADEMKSSNSYNAWTPKLLIAAYNFQYSQKDPGMFAHNPKYVIQVVYDTLESLGADVSKMTRP